MGGGQGGDGVIDNEAEVARLGLDERQSQFADASLGFRLGV